MAAPSPTTAATGAKPGCLIASHGPCHRDLCDRSAAALGRIDPGFAV
jgi:3'(2'), 5'-bisphosphate nucleotidase